MGLIVNPTNPEYAPYTAEEIAVIKGGAVEGAEGYLESVSLQDLIDQAKPQPSNAAALKKAMHFLCAWPSKDEFPTLK